MTNAVRDENRITGITAVLNSDGSTITAVTANSSNKSLSVDDNTTGDDLGSPENAPRDGNYRTVLWATSSVDGVTPVAVYCDSDGKLLINSN